MNLPLRSSSPPWRRRCGPWRAALAGLLAGGTALASPVVFTHQHIDLRIAYSPAAEPALQLVISDDESLPRTDHDLTNAVLVIAESARLSLPVDLPPLGNAGDPLWVIPASQNPELPYLGVSAEGNPTGVFDGPLQLLLRQVEGPGQFFLWQAELGGLQFLMNTRDGVDETDVYFQPVNGHSHLDWGFTTSGVYRLTFQASGRRLGETTNLLSAPATLTLHLLPLPPASPFQRWQAEHWPDAIDPAVIGPDADPDRDGWVNLWEYALGLDPTTSDPPSDPVPRLDLAAEILPPRAILSVLRSATATDLTWTVHGADAPQGPWQRLGEATDAGPVSDGLVAVTFQDSRPVSSRAAAFYQFELRLNASP